MTVEAEQSMPQARVVEFHLHGRGCLPDMQHGLRIDHDAAMCREHPGARSIVRPIERDMFRLGADEAYDEGFAAGAASVIPPAGR